MELYERWRSLHAIQGDDTDVLPVPTAFELADFEQWRIDEETHNTISYADLAAEAEGGSDYIEEEASEFSLAEKCKHVLHPAHADSAGSSTILNTTTGDSKAARTTLWCPTCTLQHHTTLIDALYTNWTETGGPWRSTVLSNNKERMIYSGTSRAYQSARVSLVNLVCEFESMAEQEGNWNLAHPERDMETVMEYSATAALQRYHEDYTFPAQLGDVEPRSAPQTPTNKRLRAKKFGYSPDTPEDTAHRPQGYWARNQISYDSKSPHACPSPEGYQDTSYYTSWQFSVSQCKILFCWYDTSSMLLKYRHLNEGPDRGLDNPHVQRLVEVIKKYLAGETPEKRANWYAYLKGASDVFLVWNGTDMEDEENSWFDRFERTPALVGSHVEEYAWLIGDIDDEEWEMREALEEEEETEEGGEEGQDEEEDFYDQMSVASDSESDDKAKGIDSMDLDEGDEG